MAKPRARKPAASKTSPRSKKKQPAEAAGDGPHPTDDRPPLATAEVAIREGRFADALVALLVEWARTPSAPLAELIGIVGTRAKIDPGVAAKLRGKSKAALAAWSALARRAAPHERGALLASLADAPSKEGIARLALVARWLPDPRVDETLVTLLEAVPYRATSTQPFWIRLYALAEQITDPRQLARLSTADAAGVAQTMREWLRTRTQKLVTVLESRLAIDRAAAPLVEDMLAFFGPRKLSIGTQNLEALMQAVYAAPDDDGPRLVLADALLERGDPRGELLSLQLEQAPSPSRQTHSTERERKKREKELLDAHGKQWLGELAPVVMAGYRFERGFLAECRVENRHLDRIRKVVGHRAWSTVHTLSGSAAIGLHPVMRSLRRFAFVSYEAANHEELPDAWHDLLVGRERPIESLRYTGVASDRHWEDALERNDSVRPGVQGRWVHVPQAEELAALCTCSALPQLRELIVAEEPDLVAEPLFAAPVMKRLHAFGLVFDARSTRGAPLRWFANALRDAPVPILRFELGSFHATQLELVRGEGGYRQLTMTVGPTMRSSWSEQLVNEAIAILDAMPPSLYEAKIHLRRNTEAQQVARLRAAVAQRGLASYEVSTI